MKISRGLFNNMVLQRDRHNLSQTRFEGECGNNGLLFLRVKAGGKTLKTFAKSKAGASINGKFSGILRRLPAGGPYEIELFIEDSKGKQLDKIHVRNVLVGDVWILAGQSNMEGIGHLKYAAKPDEMVRAFYMDDRWEVAKDPIHNISKSIDQVHSDLAGGRPPERPAHVGVGPGIAFGQEMRKRTGLPQGLIACAHGGTSMDQWNPKLKSNGSRSLYGAMLRRFHKNGGKIAGVVWYQGCSNAGPQHSQYTQLMIDFVKAVRNDLDNPRLPIATVQIAGFCGTSFTRLYWNSIQEQQRRLPEKIGCLAVVPAIDLSLDDNIHVSGFDQHRLGKRLAQAMSVLRGNKKAGLPPIELQSVTTSIEKKTQSRVIVVKFRNVMGHLQAPGRASGFHIIKNDEISPFVFRIDLENDKAIIRVGFPSEPENMFIHYGYGLAPYCNITDSADRSLPVFGPLPLTF